MEQMYLVEIFIDKVTIFASEEDEKSSANKNLIVKVKFGPKVQFIIKEGQLAVNDGPKDDVIDCDELGRRKWSRTIRVGKSYLFPSYPDTVLMTLSKFPLEIEVWNDDENEVEIFVGIGTMQWDTEFFYMLKESSDSCKLHEPLNIKQHTPLFAECCCKQVGEIAFILRLSALGDSIITEFQQLMKDPESFVFRTNKAPSMFQCKRIEGDDPNFCMAGSLYETTTLEDPDIVNNAQKKIEICTELQSCGVTKGNAYTCEHGTEKEGTSKKYAIDKIRMGDITGPCGNANCALAHKVRVYLRQLEAYKKEAAEKVTTTKDEASRKICGICSCKDDRWHRETCPDYDKDAQLGGGGRVTCKGCGGATQAGETCVDKTNKMYGTGATPKGSKTKIVQYVYSVPKFKESIFGKDYIVQNSTVNFNYQCTEYKAPVTQAGCACTKSVISASPMQVINTLSTPNIRVFEDIACTSRFLENNPFVYNLTTDMKPSRRNVNVYNCTEIPEDKDCKCSPPKPTPPCKTFDCDCITETINKAARKAHKPYCPQYKHKSDCPLTMQDKEEDKKKGGDDDDDEAEPLPYGLPPIHLGPCPVIGKPCTYPDGFARMYKTAALTPQPPSYSDAGKVCCSKEYERIKKALNEIMKNERDHDFRCINRFNVDTERRCCDKEQVLLSLMGKSCCGSHKHAIQEKFKDAKDNK